MSLTSRVTSTESSAVGAASCAPAAFLHEAFFYNGADEYTRGTTAYVEEGLAVGEVVLVAVPAANGELIRSGLGDRVESVEFVDMAEIGRNPGRIIPVWLEFVAHNARAGRRVRGIGEPIWAGRSPSALVECQWHESLLNLAFADGPGLPLMCPYDVGALAPDVVAEAERSHPYLRYGGTRQRSSTYRGAPAVDHDFDVPLSTPPVGARVSTVDVGDLAAIRHRVHELGVEAGLSGGRIDDLVLAVNEAATNSLRHGGGHGVLRSWDDGDSVVCEVSDSGRLTKALAGRHGRTDSADGGRGLWLIHQMCDLVEVRSGSGGTTVRMTSYLR